MLVSYIPFYNVTLGTNDPSSPDFDYDAECQTGTGPECSTLAGAIGWLASKVGDAIFPELDLVPLDWESGIVLYSSSPDDRVYCEVRRTATRDAIYSHVLGRSESFGAPA